MNNRMLQRGIELTTKAAQLDQQGNYAAALKQYELGIECFMSMLRRYDNPTVIKKLKPKIAEYMTRAEQLTNILHPELKEEEKQNETENSDLLAFPTPPSLLELEKEKIAVTVPASREKLHFPTIPGENVKNVKNNNHQDDDDDDDDDNVVGLHVGDTGWCYERLFATFFRAANSYFRVEEPTIHGAHEIANFVALCECAIKQLRRSDAAKAVKIELVTGFDTCDGDTRREALMALLDVAKSFEEHGVTLVLTKKSVQTSTIVTDSGRCATLSCGLDMFERVDSFSLGMCDYTYRKVAKACRISFKQC